MTANATAPLVAPSARGRTFTTTRRVRLGDVAPSGRLRLDATARYLQDVAGDDATPVMGDEAFTWIVRRTTIEVHMAPVFGEALELTTWGSGTGSRWAERRTSITGEHQGRIEAASVWIYVDATTGRPKRLPQSFVDAYATAVDGRSVNARLTHPDRPVDASSGPPWFVRRADLDLFDHVNNAAYWAIAEQCWAIDDLPTPYTVEIEHHDGIQIGHTVAVHTTTPPDGDAPTHRDEPHRRIWVTAAGVTSATMVLACN